MIRAIRHCAAVLLGATLAAGVAGPSFAERAWVKDELRLNLRTGPGNQYRIKGTIKTGDSVDVLGSRSGWTQVRSGELGDGWVPEGFLQPEAPASTRLAQSEAQTAEFREQFDTLTSRVSELQATNDELSANDAGQKSEIETLTRENLELKAGARWPEWITGAAILSAGMVMGAILHSMSARRQRPKIRL